MEKKCISVNKAIPSKSTEIFSKRLENLVEKYSLSNVMQPFIDKLNGKQDDIFKVGIVESFLQLSQELEDEFFLTLLGTINKGTILTKYTNTDGIKKICERNTQSMTSLIGMNDSTECTYASLYMQKKGYKNFLTERDNMNLGIHSFITSFTTKDDDLTMWRLYGNDAKGVALHYQVQELPDGFYLAPVSYAKPNGDHPELSLITDLSMLKIGDLLFRFNNLYKWRCFFKPSEYSIEKEIRLLYVANKLDTHSTWIITGSGVFSPLITFPIVDEGDSLAPEVVVYPLLLKGITIGPQYPEPSKNIMAIQKMFNTRFAWTEQDFKVKASEIVNYKNI